MQQWDESFSYPSNYFVSLQHEPTPSSPSIVQSLLLPLPPRTSAFSFVCRRSSSVLPVAAAGIFFHSKRFHLLFRCRAIECSSASRIRLVRLTLLRDILLQSRLRISCRCRELLLCRLRHFSFTLFHFRCRETYTLLPSATCDSFHPLVSPPCSAPSHPPPGLY